MAVIYTAATYTAVFLEITTGTVSVSVAVHNKVLLPDTSDFGVMIWKMLGSARYTGLLD